MDSELVHEGSTIEHRETGAAYRVTKINENVVGAVGEDDTHYLFAREWADHYLEAAPFSTVFLTEVDREPGHHA